MVMNKWYLVWSLSDWFLPSPGRRERVSWRGIGASETVSWSWQLTIKSDTISWGLYLLSHFTCQNAHHNPLDSPLSFVCRPARCTMCTWQQMISTPFTKGNYCLILSPKYLLKAPLLLLHVNGQNYFLPNLLCFNLTSQMARIFN